jgi:hypothetical protein
MSERPNVLFMIADAHRYVAFTAPHDPRTPPPEYAALYDPAHIPLPPNYLPEHPFDNGEMRNCDESLAPWPRRMAAVGRRSAGGDAGAPIVAGVACGCCRVRRAQLCQRRRTHDVHE